MKNPFFAFFDRDRPPIPQNSAEWPKEWKTIKWKSYSNAQQISLPKPIPSNANLSEILARRHSSRDFSGKPLTALEISSLLFYSCGLTKPESDPNRSRRAHPSGGGLYPIETYLLIFCGTDDIGTGIYHYNIFGHYLEKLNGETITSLKTAFHYPWVADAAAVIFFSYIEKRQKPKYGNFAYKVGLIEAGHIGQNIYLNCAAAGIKCCALGGFDADMIHRVFNLDGSSEVLFYSIAIGK